MKKKKFITILMAVVLCICLTVPSFAAELQNSVGSVASDSDVVSPDVPVGKDQTQNKISEYEVAVSESTATSETTNKTVEVYATQSSTYSVKLPKTIVLGGNDGNGAYRVSVKGNISGNQTVNIKPATTVVLKEQATTDSKADIIATVSQAKTAWTTSEINNTSWTIQDASISADLTAGIWNGELAFIIELVNAA